MPSTSAAFASTVCVGSTLGDTNVILLVASTWLRSSTMRTGSPTFRLGRLLHRHADVDLEHVVLVDRGQHGGVGDAIALCDRECRRRCRLVGAVTR